MYLMDSASNRSLCKSPRGFTLLEMLVVIAIIVMLAAILLPSIGRARDVANVTVCQTNLRQIAIAWLAYAGDNDGRIVSSNTGRGMWVDSGTDEGALKRGALYPYLRETRIYRCPAEPFKSNFRTYSLNGYLNGEANPNVQQVRLIKHPASTFLGIEEYDPRGYNINSFLVPPTGDRWVDYPATWHSWGCNLSFCDGHVEYWGWSDKQTRSIQTFYASTPNNPDLKRLQAAAR